MKNIRKDDLPEAAVKKLKLDEMTEVFWDEESKYLVDKEGNTVRGLTLAGPLNLVTIEYEAVVKRKDHYFHQRDPYYVERGGIRSVTALDKPAAATHYALGPQKNENHVEGRDAHGTYEDSFPLVFLRQYLNY